MNLIVIKKARLKLKIFLTIHDSLILLIPLKNLLTISKLCVFARLDNRASCHIGHSCLNFFFFWVCKIRDGGPLSDGWVIENFFLLRELVNQTLQKKTLYTY